MKENCDNYVMKTSLFESSPNVINMIKRSIMKWEDGSNTYMGKINTSKILVKKSPEKCLNSAA